MDKHGSSNNGRNDTFQSLTKKMSQALGGCQNQPVPRLSIHFYVGK